ncbi:MULTISPECIES: hypothetical protein [unclassified Moorena]|uniref:hypothetical protein n=1 Tax=unclassified Moorena TaxID=2683338 RepID=UPI0013FFCCBE|nr:MULTISPECIES: hypothetical protein [unclassified Moorena]NEO12056.1 hypothetical protein [Moorena sp. SIO3E8]NEQ03484.1 hypothetical protein [Moorena sp. SIO3F7]
MLLAVSGQRSAVSGQPSPVSHHPSAITRQLCGTGFGLGQKATLREWPRCANEAGK